ncbi:CapA family protein [Embleya hyalina]|uniref:Lipoprotein n=1 Tax=Embleya hyalina TaxID=516124 RepID=A0A401YKZ0_9ACTN|nr:CapA family protein [Embleya hyalina]GCD95199.1 lipoprotein [Embleya hyalina]
MDTSRTRDTARTGRRAGVALVVVGLLSGLITLVWDADRTEGSARRDPIAAPSATAGGSSGSGAPGTGPAGKPPMSFTLTTTGDVLAYPTIIAQSQQDAGGSGNDFHRIFADVRPLVQGSDLALCHMETPYGPPEGPFTGYPIFAAPPQIAGTLADTGYDGCSTASNHTLDGGFAGVRRTLDTLDAAGVRHAGSARTEEEAAPTILEVKGVKVAHLSWTYDTNGIPLPEGKPWSVNVIDKQRIIAQARAARAAGAEVVLLSLHWGTEWQREPDEQQRTLARELTASADNGVKDVDLIVGTHNHVPQAYEKVNGTWVIYGMGDELANFPDKPRGNYSSAGMFTFTRDTTGRWSVTEARFRPLFAHPGPPFRILDVNRALADPGTPADTRALLQTARSTVVDAVLSEGAAGAGLVEDR